MFVSALEIFDRKQDTTIKAQVNDLGNFFENPLNCGPYLDRVWRLLTLYTSQYSKFCDQICRGFIDRVEPRLDPKQAFKNYQKARSLILDHSSLIKPFMNLWPEYRSETEFIQDFDSFVYVSRVEKDKIID